MADILEKKEKPWSPVERFIIRILPNDAIVSYITKKVRTKTIRGERVSKRYIENIEEADPSSAIQFYTKLAEEYDRNYSGQSGMKAKDIFSNLNSSALSANEDNYFENRTGASILYEKEIDEMKNYAKKAEEYDKVYKGLINNQHILSMPDTFIIEIGVFKKKHSGIKTQFQEITNYDEYGNIDNEIRRQNTWAHPRINYKPVKDRVSKSPDIDYEKLFELLYMLGFDPMSVIRHRRKKIINELTESVNRIVKSGTASKQSILTSLSLDVEDLVWDVKEYIIGGEKPELKDSTVEFYRPNKLAANNDLYPKGIEEPLMESGQLYDAISYKITPLQSGMMSKYIDSIRKNLLSARQRQYLKRLRQWKKLGVSPIRYSGMLGIKRAKLKTPGYLEQKIKLLLENDRREKTKDRFVSKTKEGRMEEIASKIGKTKTLIEIFEKEYADYISMKKKSSGNKIVELDYLIQGKYSESDLRILQIASVIYPNIVKAKYSR